MNAKQIAVAYGPNDECVQIGGLAFTVNISAELVAATINAAIEKATDPFRERINTLVSELDTIWHEGRAYEQKFGVKPHASEQP